MTDEEMKKAIKNCKYLSNNHYSIGGQKLHKGICSAKGNICSKIVYEGNCPILIDLVKENKEETWNGIHAQITAPKGTFERIFNEANDDDDI